MIGRVLFFCIFTFLVTEIHITGTAHGAQRRVAILDFKNVSGEPAVSWLTTAVPEMLRRRLATLRAHYVLDVQDVEEAIRGQIWQTPALSDPFVAAKVSRLAGAEAVVMGGVTRVGKEVEFRLGVVDALSGYTLQRLRIKVTTVSQESLSNLLNRMADALARAFGRRLVMKGGWPKGVDTSRVTIGEEEKKRLRLSLTAPVGAMILFGNALRERKAGNRIGALDLLNRAVKSDGNFAEALIWVGILQADRKNPKEANAAFSRALALYRTGGNRLGEATCLRNMARLRLREGRGDEALRLFRQSLAIDRDLGNEARVAQTLSDLAALGAQRSSPEATRPGESRFRKPLETFEASLTITRRIGLESVTATTLEKMAALYAKDNRNREALWRVKESLKIARGLGDEAGETTRLNRLGEVYASLGRNEKAMGQYCKALEMANHLGNDAAAAAIFTNMARSHIQQEQYADALQLAHESYIIRRRLGDWEGVAHTLNNLAAIRLGLRQTKRAMKLWCQGLAVTREHGLKRQEPLFIRMTQRLQRRHPNLSCGP